MSKSKLQGQKPSLKKRISSQVKRAKFIAETDTRRRVNAPIKSEIEQRLIKGILAQSLALHILRNSEIPASDLSRELTDIEFQSGKFLGITFKLLGRESSIDLAGALKGVFSFIPLNTELMPKTARPFFEALKERTVKFLLSQLDSKDLEKGDSLKNVNFEDVLGSVLEGMRSEEPTKGKKTAPKKKAGASSVKR